MLRRGLFAVGCILIVLPAAAVPARAGLIITIPNQTIPLGQASFVDVTIAGAGGSQLLSSYNFDLQISVNAGDAGRIEYSNPQPQGYLSSSSYVFSDNTPPPTFAGNVGTAVVPNDDYVGGDFSTNSSGSVLVDTSGKLLVRLELNADASFAVVGDAFTLSLENPSSGTGTIADLTYFLDDASNPITFESTPGTITVGPPTAIPEPSTLVLAVSAFALCGVYLCGVRAFISRKRSDASALPDRPSPGAEQLPLK
jgi:hypothetical protein